jgi:hypothetical protein
MNTTTHTHNTQQTETETQTNMNTHTITLSGEQFQALATLAAIAKSADDTTPVLQTVAIQTDGHTLTAHTTDRYRIGRLVMTREDEGQPQPDQSYYLTPELIKQLQTANKAHQNRYTEDTADAVTITWAEGENKYQSAEALLILNGGRYIMPNTYTGTYPPVGKLVTAPDPGATVADLYRVKTEHLAALGKIRTPDQPRPGKVEWLTVAPREQDGFSKRTQTPLEFQCRGNGWRLHYVMQPLAMLDSVESAPQW